MKKAIIFYFSGTGNTELVAGMLRNELEKRQYTAELIRMEDVLKNKLPLDLSRYDLIGIGCQVIGFAAPGLVYDFIRTLPKTNSQKTFVFRTAGGVAPINFNASKPMIRMLTRRGYDVFYERIFSIGSNWIAKFDDDVIVNLYEATQKKVGLMCDSLIKGEERSLKTGLLQRLLMECVMAVTPVFFRLVGKDFNVKDSCSHCGLCVKNCPAGNIVDKNGKIGFKLSCSCCMRCVYSCPKNAIQFRNFSSFAIPGGYNIKKILDKPCIPCDSAKKPEPPFFKGYLTNDAI